MIHSSEFQKVIIEGINNYFSQYVDGQSIKKVYNILKDIGLPESDIRIIMLCVGTVCANHYQKGYNEAQKNGVQ